MIETDMMRLCPGGTTFLPNGMVFVMFFTEKKHDEKHLRKLLREHVLIQFSAMITDRAIELHWDKASSLWTISCIVSPTKHALKNYKQRLKSAAAGVTDENA